MSDFELNTFPELLACEFAWQIVQGEVFSVKNMDDQELRESIVDDLLSVTFWEIQHSESVSFDTDALMRFITGSMRARVLDQLTHPEIAGLIEFTDRGIRIKTDRAILQAAQDYAGVWYGDFKPTDPTTKIITVNTDVLASAIRACGSTDALATSLAMDLVSDAPVNHPHSKLVN